MNIAIFGTGMVGQTLAGKLSSIGHAVVIGTRDPKATLERNEKGPMGNPPYRVWAEQHPKVELATFADAASRGEIVISVLAGQGAISGLRAAGTDALAGKILMDVSNPLDFSKGFPPSLTVCNTDSLAEQIQRELPKTKVVKTLNTVNANLMVDPGKLAGGEHTIFVSGNDAGAKATVTTHLQEWFGWKDVVDLGDITSARGVEMYLPLWVALMSALKTPMFSVRVVR
jgi:predicted dinucleotide-binding enzyme